MPRVGAGLVACLLITLAWAGCLQDESVPKDEAPLGPRSLAVPPLHDGDRHRIAATESGHEVVFEFSEDDPESPPTRRIVPYRHTQSAQLEVARASGALDRFVRPFEGVLFRSTGEYTDEEATGLVEWDMGFVYEASTRMSRYLDRAGLFRLGDNMCPDCGQDEFRFSYREYEEGLSSMEGSLAGKVLQLGKSVGTNATFTMPDGSVYRFHLNYTATRSTKIHGIRAFEVQPEAGFELLSKPSKTPERPAQEEPPSSGGGGGGGGGSGDVRATPVAKKLSPRPQSTFKLWFTAKCPFAVRSEVRAPFAYESNWYWRNETMDTVSCARGATALTWGQGSALPPVERLPGARFHKGPAYHDQANGGLQYPLAKAWSALKGDVTFRSFQDYLSRHPETYPMGAMYYPDGRNNAYTWTMWFGEEARARSFATRLQGLPSPVPVRVYQNEDSSAAGMSFRKPLERAALAEREFVDLADALKSYRAVRPGSGDPAMFVTIASLELGSSRNQFHITLAAPEYLGGSAVWMGRDPVVVDLEDGGLVSFNQTYDFLFGVNRWPWTSVPKPADAPGVDLWDYVQGPRLMGWPTPEGGPAVTGPV